MASSADRMAAGAGFGALAKADELKSVSGLLLVL